MSRNFLLYIVLDMSSSMLRTDNNGTKRIQGALKMLDTLIRATQRRSSLKAGIKICLIGFNETVFTLFPASGDKNQNDILTFRHLNKFIEWKKNLNDKEIIEGCVGQTYYTVLFNKLSEVIKNDQKLLIENNSPYYRPLVYFLTDGKPEGETESQDSINVAFEKLFTENPGNESENEVKSPVIIPVGIGTNEEVNYENLKKYAAGKVATLTNRETGKKEKITGTYKKNNGNITFVVQDDYENHLDWLVNAIVRSIMDSFSDAQGQGEVKISNIENIPKRPNGTLILPLSNVTEY